MDQSLKDFLAELAENDKKVQAELAQKSREELSQEFIDYVKNHGGEAATMAADIANLQQLVGEDSVKEQISKYLLKAIVAILAAILHIFCTS